jgi:hypothetical protein
MAIFSSKIDGYYAYGEPTKDIRIIAQALTSIVICIIQPNIEHFDNVAALGMQENGSLGSTLRHFDFRNQYERES